MQIKRLVIENFKSIERIELEQPNPFTVFVGPNGSGKSNIFEALEFFNVTDKARELAESLFGGTDKFLNRKSGGLPVKILFVFDGKSFQLEQKSESDPRYEIRGSRPINDNDELREKRSKINSQFFSNFTRLFIGNERLVKLNFTDSKRLTISASNMETVLKRLLDNQVSQEEIHDWLTLFVPGFKAVKVLSSSFSGKDELLVYEQGIERPFTKDLISDGTLYIITLLTAVYQSDEPQFLCIEEPENGLHPEVLESLIPFFRKICQEKGHYIWLNTHSETIARLLTTDEIILVNKRNGTTQTKQVKSMNIYDLTTDEAWLSGALGGGVS